MRKHITLAVFLSLAAITARAQGFALGGGVVFDNYGWLDSERKAWSTEYAGLRVTPDWRLPKNFGMRLDIGASWAFYANTTGEWERPMHAITNIGLTLVPYYEFIVNQWFIDLGFSAGCRFRLPYMNGEMSRYLMTLSVAIGADFRFGRMITNHWGVYADLRAERTLYDLLFNTYYSSHQNTAGAIGASAGVIYKF